MLGKKKSVDAQQIPAKTRTKKPFYKRIWFWVLVLFVLMVAMGGNEEADSPEQNEEQEIQGQVEVQPQEEQQDEVAEVSQEEKDLANDADFILWGMINSAEGKYNAIVAELDAVATGNSTALDLFQLCDDTIDQMRSCWSAAGDIDVEGVDEYVDACKYYFLHIQTICEDLQTYIDSGKTSDLSEVQDDLESYNSYVINVVATRQTFLMDSGFTLDEISAMTSGE